MEGSNESDNDSTLIPLTSEEARDNIPSGDEYDAEPMPTDMLEDICDGSQSHPRINRGKARYKICDCIKQGQAEWKAELSSRRNMGKGLHKVFKAVVNEIYQALTI